MESRWCVFFLSMILAATALNGCQCGVSTGEPGGDDDGATAGISSTGWVAVERPVTRTDGVFPPQPIVPEVPLAPAAPVSPPRQLLPLPMRQPVERLLEPPRQELPHGGIADTIAGSGGGQAGRAELLVDTTRPVVRSGYFVLGFDYVAGMTDIDNNGNFAPEPQINTEDDGM